jgi:hypothetical protein
MKRKHKQTLDKGVEARRRARKSALSPAVTRVVADKRKKPPKHRNDLLHEEV